MLCICWHWVDIGLWPCLCFVKGPNKKKLQHLLIVDKMNNHANLTGSKPDLRTKTWYYKEIGVCIVIMKPSVFVLVWLTGRGVGWGWSARTADCLKGKATHANPLCSFLGTNTWALTLCCLCCPCTDMLLVRVRNISALCNIFHLSSSRSAALHCRAQTLSTQITFILWLPARSSSLGGFLTVVHRILSYISNSAVIPTVSVSINQSHWIKAEGPCIKSTVVCIFPAVWVSCEEVAQQLRAAGPLVLSCDFGSKSTLCTVLVLYHGIPVVIGPK